LRKAAKKNTFIQKGAHKMLMKLTPAVNFINISCEPFSPIFFAKKLQSQNVIREKLRKALSYEIDTWLDCKR